MPSESLAVQIRGERFAARAQALSDAEKQTVWDAVRQAIPQMNVYEKRTDRNIRVVRLRRAEPEVSDGPQQKKQAR